MDDDIAITLESARQSMIQELDRIHCDKVGVQKLNDFANISFLRLKRCGAINISFGEDPPTNNGWARDTFDKDHTRFLRKIVTMQQLARAQSVLTEVQHADKSDIEIFAFAEAQRSQKPSDTQGLAEDEDMPAWKRNIAAYSCAKIPRYQTSTDSRIVIGANVADKYRLQKMLIE